MDTSEKKIEKREKEGKERKIRSNETGEKTWSYEEKRKEMGERTEREALCPTGWTSSVP